MYNRPFTLEFITELKPNEVFVFGSNLQGMHAGGAARIAHERFGAVWGQGVGLQGQSYAIPSRINISCNTYWVRYCRIYGERDCTTILKSHRFRECYFA